VIVIPAQAGIQGYFNIYVLSSRRRPGSSPPAENILNTGFYRYDVQKTQPSDIAN